MRVVALMLLVAAACHAPQSGVRCDGALPMPCVVGERCVYLDARGCLLCRCREPAFVPLR